MWKGLGVLLLGALAGVFGTIAYELIFRPPPPLAENKPRARSSKSDSPESVPGQRSVMALGTIQPMDGIVRVASPLIGYRVKQVLAQEGQLVSAEEGLIQLDDAEAKAELQLAETRLAEGKERQEAEILLAKQRVAAAELTLRQAEEAMPLELDAQRSRIGVAELKVQQAEKDVQHLEELRNLAQPLASAQQVEHQRIALEAANAELTASEVALKRLEQSLNFQREAATAELQASQQALALAEKGTGLESLAQAVAIAQLKLSRTTIQAATPGTILAELTSAGEIVGQQPLMQMADLQSLICEAEVDAADIRHLRKNHLARITSRAFPEIVLEGRILHLGNVVNDPTLRPIDPRRTVVRNVAKAVIVFDPQQLAKLEQLSHEDRRAALVGLQVDVEFPLSGNDS